MTLQEAFRGLLVPTDLGGRQVLAKFFRALGDPTRLVLLEFLVHDEHTVSECVQAAGLSQGRVSSHLGCLADCGYVVARREGRHTYYRVTDPRVADLVQLARSLAADNTAALAECARIDDRSSL
jgi:DNA-binding transcriptional ArsR family regulator